jgi:integrative and conjugative element protein (TIGR02256 family)
MWRLDVGEATLASITAMARDARDGRETGGILLGRGPDTHGVVHVEEAGDAGPNAVRRPDHFLRDLDHSRQLADKAWDRSEAVWVGEWHTHLNTSGCPSEADLITYQRLLATSELEFEVFVAIIATAGPGDDWQSAELSPWLITLGKH